MKIIRSTLMVALIGLVACSDRDDARPVTGSVPQAQDVTEQVAVTGSAALTGGVSEGGKAIAELQEVSEADVERGRKVYTKHCIACHGSGAAGAPRLNDPTNWEPRIAQGMDTLVTHALKGFQGSSGFMPAKGGFASLGDDEVKAAVVYMVAQNR